MQYEKQYTPPAQLLEILKDRGLNCSDVADAVPLLRSVGYYRLTGYLYPFLRAPKSAHHFKLGSSLGQAFNLYEFDREFRLLVFDQIERIEIAVRSAIVNIMCAETGDVFWLTNPSHFADSTKFNKTLALIDKELQVSREDFITHFKQAYEEAYPPSWMAAEIIPLGLLTRVYENISNNRTRKRIAQYFGLNIPVFTSWMTIVTLTRNICCHHARLWNRFLSLRALTMSRPTTPWISNNVQQGRIFFTLCILKHFVDIIRPQNTFKQDLMSLLTKYPTVDTRAMGFPVEWQEEPLWR
jgi:abortive infection bacteriophage resistance protein